MERIHSLKLRNAIGRICAVGKWMFLPVILSSPVVANMGHTIFNHLPSGIELDAILNSIQPKSESNLRFLRFLGNLKDTSF